jgi:hypothetical protein
MPRLYLRDTQTVPTALGAYRDLVSQLFAASVVAAPLTTTGDYSGERQFGTDASTPMRFISERLIDGNTLIEPVTFSVWVAPPATFSGRLRARLSKVPSDGSNVESLIAQADASVDLSGTAYTWYSFAATPTPTEVVAGDRFIMRLTVINAAGTGTVNLHYGAPESEGDGDSLVDVVEGLNFHPNTNPVYLRRTAVNAIGTFFDALPTFGETSFTTGVVNTVASGTQIQWTRTAGGTVLEWITGRIAPPGWTISQASVIADGVVWALESATAANCGITIKLFRRQPDGTELLFYTKGPSAELTTSALSYVVSGVSLELAISFDVVVRIVLRCYIVIVG